MALCLDSTFLIISCFCFCLFADDLEIIIEEKPEVCDYYAAIGDTLYIEYTGMLRDGRIFDSSMQDGRSPLKFQLGAGTLIRGWERGVQGMCVGEKRKLIVPSHLGYGSNGIDGVIPPDSTLLFQVHLVNLERPSIVNQLYDILFFASWPIGILSLVYYLYQKLATAITKDERKSEKRSGKKRR